MIPILYPQAETKFNTNGIGRLIDCISCKVTEERNGIYECEFKYPVTGRYFSQIKEGCIIYATHDDTRDPQPFDIYARSAPINEVVTFNARHISYRLINVILTPYEAASCAAALAGMETYTMNANPFRMWTDKDVAGHFAVKAPASARSMLGGTDGSILDTYGTGEYQFDDFTVRLYLHRGQDTDVTIRYGKNLIDITDERDYGEIYNAVVPYWLSEDGELVTLPEEYIVASGATLQSDYWTQEDNIIITNENGMPFEFSYAVLQPVPMDLSYDFLEKPTADQMRALATSRLEASNAWAPKESINVDFVQLWQTEEYKSYAPLQRLNLCDTATVIYNDIGVNARLKVVKVVYDTLMDRYSSMELGEPKTTFAEVIRTATTTAAKQESKSMMDEAIANATDLITGGLGGHVVIGQSSEGYPNEILIMDTEDKVTAVNVIRINENGIAFSQNGYNGTYRTAWTIDGSFVADFITAGTLSANRIGGGIIRALQGNNYWNLTNGVFYNEADGIAVLINSGAAYFYAADDPTKSGIIHYNTALNALFLECDNLIFGHRVDGVPSLSIVIGKERSNILLNDSVQIAGALQVEGSVSFGGTLNGVAFTVATITVGGEEKKQLRLATANVDFISIGSTNYVSGYKVSLSGSVYIYGSLYTTSSISCTTLTQRSDERLKKIKAWDNHYDEIIADLQPVLFSWRDGDSLNHIGLSAQRVLETLKKHGIKNSGIVIENNGQYEVDYIALSMLMLNKVNKQAEEIESLQNKVDELERKVNALCKYMSCH